MLEVELLSPPQTDASRALPHALGAEKALLSVLLEHPVEYIPAAQGAGLTPEDFYLPSHATLYRILLELDAARVPIELITLTQHLADRNILDNIGGRSELANLYTYSPTAAHFHHHLTLLLEKSTLRRAIATCTGLISAAYDGPADLPTFLDRLETDALHVRRHDPRETTTSSPTDHLSALTVELDKLLKGEPVDLGLPTGFPSLDRMIRGLAPGQLFIIAARPSMGKTALLLTIIDHLALHGQPDHRHCGALFSVETPSDQITRRLLYSHARISQSDLKPGLQLTKEQLQRVLDAAGALRQSPIILDDTASIAIETLRAKARRMHQREPLAWLAVDYVQLMRSTSPQATSSREREIAEISAGLKAIAKELAIPVIALAQLNREGERLARKPRMSDLRESGSMEQDADLIGLLYREEYYARNDDQDDLDDIRGKAELILAKNRNGPTGVVPLTFIPELMRFESRAHDSETSEALDPHSSRSDLFG